MNSSQLNFLILALAIGMAAAACDAAPQAVKALEAAPGVQLAGHIANRSITESSGLVASRTFPGVFWTHNDGGGKKQILYGMTRDGKSLAEFRVTGALVHDWEDIAIDDKKHLYVGDIGNNDAKRSQIAVYEIDEPDPKASTTFVPVKRGWQLRFPAAPFDCESLFIHDGHGYVISKVFNDEHAEIYRFPLTDQKEPFVLESVVRLKIDSPVTGADISADGNLLGIVSKSGAYVYRINGKVAKAGKGKPHHTKFKHEHIEACCFVPEGLLATSESGEIFLFTDEAFHPLK